jgi:hypothetical protein
MAATLRHGLTCLWPSEIADQWYCEQKVHLQHVHPEVRYESRLLEAGEAGEAGHADLAAQAEPVTRAQVEQAVREGKRLALSEWVLEGRYRDVPIRGRPDFLALEGREATLLLDFKFSAAYRPFPNHRVQADIYGFLAEATGLSARGLYVGVVLFPPGGRVAGPREAAKAKDKLLKRLNKKGTLQEIHDRCLEARGRLLQGKSGWPQVERDGWRAFLERYDRTRVEGHLAWAMDYWQGYREPQPETRFHKKCFACPLNAVGLCKHALREPDTNFVGHRADDGAMVVSR